MSATKVLVTGAAGFIGWHLVEALTRDGIEVVALDNLQRGLPYRPARGVEFILGDVRDGETVRKAMRGCRYVFHLAAQSRVMAASADVSYGVSTNVLGVAHVLRQAREAGVERIVFSSSREVYGEALELPVSEAHPIAPRNDYGASKAAAELYCAAYRQSYDLDVSVLRLANVYGPGDQDRLIPTWLDHARRNEDLELFGGDQVLDFIHVEYVVQALRRAAETPLDGRPVNLGSGVGCSLRALAERIASLPDARVTLRMLPARREEVVSFVADTSRMRTLLNVTPPTDPLHGLAALWASVPVGAPTPRA